VTGVTASNNITVPTQSSPVINPGTQDEPNVDELQNPTEEQEKSLFGASDENAEKIKEEIKNFRERIMEEVEDGLKEQGIELNLP
jgi:ribosome recycling factor